MRVIVRHEERNPNLSSGVNEPGNDVSIEGYKRGRRGKDGEDRLRRARKDRHGQLSFAPASIVHATRSCTGTHGDFAFRQIDEIDSNYANY